MERLIKPDPHYYSILYKKKRFVKSEGIEKGDYFAGGGLGVGAEPFLVVDILRLHAENNYFKVRQIFFYIPSRTSSGKLWVETIL